MEAAREKALRKEDYWGGFVIDEMKIQVRILNLLNIIPIQKYLHNPSIVLQQFQCCLNMYIYERQYKFALSH